MSNVVNLNKFRKAKARADARAEADENAVRFGRTKAQKHAELTEAEKATLILQGHKISDD